MGADRLEGGEGADVYLFDTALTAVAATGTFAGADVDLVVGFAAGTDKIALSGAAYAQATGAFAVYNVAGGVSEAGNSTNLFIFDTTSSVLFYDTTPGTTNADRSAIATLEGVTQINASDFIIIA